MTTTNATIPDATAAAEPSDGAITPVPHQPPTLTVTQYQQLAAKFMAALDEAAQIIPNMETAHTSTADFVRAYQNVPVKFLATTTSGVEQSAELQGVKKFDVAAARDTLQFLDAFGPGLDKASALKKKLQFTLNSRKASLGFDSLQIYDIAKGLARDPDSADLEALLENMRRDLGRSGPKTPSALKKVGPTPGIGVPTPRLLAEHKPGGRTDDDAEPRG
ncbi:MAG: hypothetical protein DMF56_27240 [Acidobacteria bacterium]|nr:MAG: hypothetical protein DMF56_27240 [Acidobacteriota bacterium]